MSYPKEERAQIHTRTTSRLRAHSGIKWMISLISIQYTGVSVSAHAISKQGPDQPYSFTSMSRGLRPLWFTGPLPIPLVEFSIRRLGPLGPLGFNVWLIEVLQVLIAPNIGKHFALP